MADTATVVEGKIKYREGKKWKSRWCVLKKPSPVADCLQLLLYKDVHESLRAGGRVKTSLMLEGYYGLESGFSFDKEVNVLAIICQKHIAVMAFDNRENLILFEVKIRRSLGQEFQFPVQLVKVPSGSRLSVEGVRLLIHGLQFCLTAHVPPRILHSWNVTDLRRFGTVDGKFCFEGGSRCGKGTGAHALQTDQAEEITEILRLNSLGSSSASFKPSNNRKIRPLPLILADPPPPLPGISPKLPFSLSSPSSPRLGDVASNLLELRYSTPLVVSMDPLEDAEEGLADCLSISSDGSSTCFEDTPIRSSPAATVLRPRSGRDYQVIERRCKVSGSVSSSPVVQSPTVSNVFIYEGSFPAPTSPRSPSISSRLSQERELSPTYKSGLVKHSLGTTSSLTRNQSTVLSWCNESSQFHDGSSVHKVSRTCHLAQSEPCSSQVESSGITVPCVKSSSPISVQAPSPSSPEVQEPMLNYAEIDLSGASSPPPLEISLSKRAKRTPKPAVISYTEIDHRATTALQAAGREHALSREDTLRRTSGFTRKASVPSTPKDRKGSSNSFRDRKLSTCSSDSV